MPLSAIGAEDAPKEKITYAEHVQPILRQHCFTCHNQEKRKSDLALDSYAGAMEGGASGEVLYADDLDSSRLWQLITHEDSPSMPPEQDKLPQEQLDVIRAWIEGGLLENAGSKTPIKKKSGLTSLQPSADNRPAGEPAMPEGLWQEPVVFSPRSDAVTAIATSPWAPLIAVAGQRQISFYHAESSQLLGIVPFVEGVPKVLRFSRDGNLLVAGGGRGAAVGLVALYDVKTGRRIITIGDELDTVLAADIHPDLSLVALGGPGKIVRLMDTSDGSVKHEIRKHTDWVTDLEFSPDGKYLITADRSSGLHVWEAKTARPVSTLQGHKEAITAVAWRADSKVVASSSKDGTVRLWQPDGKQLKNWAAHPGGTESVAFARDGRLITAGRDRTVKIWDAEGKLLKTVATFDDIVLEAHFTHDAVRAVAGGWNGEVRLVHIDSGEMQGHLPANPPTLAMRIEVATAELAQAQKEADQAAKAWEAAKQKLAEAESVVATYQTELAQAKAQAEIQTKAREAANKLVTSSEASYQQAIAAHGKANLRVTETEAMLATAQQQLADAKAVLGASPEEKGSQDLEAAQVAVLEQLVSSAQAALEQARPLAEKTGQKRSETEAAKQEAATAAQKAEAAWQLASARLAEITEHAGQLPDVKALQAAQEALQKAHQVVIERQARVQSTLDAAIAGRDAFAAAGKAMTAELQRITAQLEEASRSLAEVEAKKNLSQEEFAKKEAALQEATKRLAEAKAAYDKIVAEHTATEAEKKAKAEAARQAQSVVDLAKQQAATIADQQAQFNEAEKLRQQYAK